MTPEREACEAIYEVLNDWAVRRKYKDLRAWANKYAEHANAQVRREAAASLQVCDVLGK